MVLNATHLSALTRLFSSAVFQELAKKGRSPLFSRLFGQTGIAKRLRPDTTVGDAFDIAFAHLKRAGQRDEYIFRAALTKNVLMGKHSLRTASMLNEFRAGPCRADLVILNGTATAYEIKSDRDTLARLSRQVENYKKVFASVNVIASDKHIDNVIANLPSDVGVMRLSKRSNISCVREAVNFPDRICQTTVLGSLRSNEAIDILKNMGFDVPTVPNTQRHAILREMFSSLPPAALHKQMVLTLKRTRNLAPLGDLVKQIPESLNAAALSIPIRKADHNRLVTAIMQPLPIAMAWD